MSRRDKHIFLFAVLTVIIVAVVFYRVELWPFLWAPVIMAAYLFGETGGVSAGAFSVLLVAARLMSIKNTPLLGADIWLEMAVLIIMGGLAGYLMRIEVRMKEKALSVAARDGMTGLYNRLYFQGRLDEEVDRATRSKERLGLIIMDFDHFKVLNDTCGHKGGDRVLKAVAKIVSNEVRKSDVVARIGGEEIAIIVPNSNGLEADTAERVRMRIEAAGEGKWPEWCTASFGVAAFDLKDNMSAKDEEDLFERSDQALYKAKTDGRNCVHVWDGGRVLRLMPVVEDQSHG